jgi:hypothetical protein
VDSLVSILVAHGAVHLLPELVRVQRQSSVVVLHLVFVNHLLLLSLCFGICGRRGIAGVDLFSQVQQDVVDVALSYTI